MADYRTAFNYMQSWGLADAILPFLLFFALIFAILQKVKIFKSDEKTPDRKMNGIIAFVIAMMVVVPHIIGQYPSGLNPVRMINELLPTSAVILFAIVVVLIIVGLMGQEDKPGITPVARLLGFGGILIILYLFISNMFPKLGLALGPLNDPGIQALAVVLGVFGIIVWFIMKKDKTPDPNNRFDWLHNLFGGKK